MGAAQIAGLVLAGAIGAGGWLVALGLLGMLRAARAAPPPPAAAWAPMPGNRLELGDTGFYVSLNLMPAQPMYWLFSPEHFVVGYGGDLGALKSLGERLARERLEFACSHLPLSMIGRP
jgi:hypothetical protein